MSKVCPRCKNLNSSIPKMEYHGEKILSCVICGQTSRESRFLEATLFHRITASEEVLAPYFVRADFDEPFLPWFSTLTNESFETHEQAIAATVAKLKEVCDD